ncbi:cytochrome o ubiquinol/quinol oxidase subunit IV [Alicyclobacillus acidoterrestris]|uniref:Cytochrome C oxidase subunit IV family protein n=1 Tax=Alicyclobacillus acidoterrestris (strain ATCC 49025 / DSM 3922 / CIP 106132 / NCIMB 13137 / GD3B) TaxID=1356854 RepID=T0CJU5_ALIAG|nr:cytochrome C oxidase subunit IV family protein [Alicyclobacillus acidoterrestris]EPZ53039.1 hypothetical protein N007_18380 [Alicyclobacillus acidoterrestris ATCC 49025]UNO47200.1 cytochrome C oxidase subunit IV family protein [Alicyclobacillus acidoterrestris]
MSTVRTGGTHKSHSPKLYILGYLLSLVLTAISFVLALTHSMNVGPLIVLLTILGALQIFVQLFFFMHITEGDGPPFHSVLLLLGLIFTFAVALMSVWIMAFGTNVSY